MKKVAQIREPIKTWPVHERPREVLLEQGPDHLSDAALIAILLRTGTAGKDAVHLARELLDRFGGLSGLLRAPEKELKKVKGMGPAKITQLMAALEIIKRQLRDNLKKSGVMTFQNPQAVFDYLQTAMGAYKKEVFKVLYLTAGNQLIDDEDLFQGTLNESAVYPREVAKRALEKNAYSIIIAHNHPSGLLKATDRDISITRKLIKALKTVDIKVLDHVVVAGNHCLSMRLERLVEF
ncbi:MAG: DNA repair protein RadC [PVC group bacterium]